MPIRSRRRLRWRLRSAASSIRNQPTRRPSARSAEGPATILRQPAPARRVAECRRSIAVGEGPPRRSRSVPESRRGADTRRGYRPGCMLRNSKKSKGKSSTVMCLPVSTEDNSPDRRCAFETLTTNRKRPSRSSFVRSHLSQPSTHWISSRKTVSVSAAARNSPNERANRSSVSKLRQPARRASSKLTNRQSRLSSRYRLINCVSRVDFPRRRSPWITSAVRSDNNRDSSTARVTTAAATDLRSSRWQRCPEGRHRPSVELTLQI